MQVVGVGAAGGPDWVLVTVMSSCLGGLFLVSISVISCLLVAARRRRHPSPPPSSSGHTKVGSDILLSRFILQDLPQLTQFSTVRQLPFLPALLMFMMIPNTS